MAYTEPLLLQSDPQGFCQCVVETRGSETIVLGSDSSSSTSSASILRFFHLQNGDTSSHLIAVSSVRPLRTLRMVPGTE